MHLSRLSAAMPRIHEGYLSLNYYTPRLVQPAANGSSSPSLLDTVCIMQAIVKGFEGNALAWMRMLDFAATDLLDSSDAARLLDLKLYRLSQERY
ncbi:uncharacterized protein Z519_08408 [Cladophialophora bantiana CBS 173.52]|uniref:Uncharacterized protein n=1 Tax=Cladophialophora bantiana (strain ATCC 10958 / CBS 173.52 / CDC B-1940 / NIH 8579) TaxID=1442370 RepID=A0A0D2HIP9_CLAB1|nr:uncharacterized protein Z519_08408 [Cladophialophora bantiana CBS 173.52]KIW90625.1 hypothetical protein Z519_08408 [Cladophialophora bantiana CBS 173.52]